MSRIRSRDTKPEREVRSLLHAAGFRFRLHRKDLPGRPDIVLSKWHAVIDVRGCFWHAHSCHLFQQPRQNSGFWLPKLAGNRDRDRRNALRLTELGWRHLIIWECALRPPTKLSREVLIERLGAWIRDGPVSGEIEGGSA